MKKTLRIAGMEVKPGERKKKLVKIGEMTDSSEICLPFIVVNGKDDGPTLVLRGGENGSEYCGQEQVRKSSLMIDPSQLSGSVIAIPTCNPLAYRNGTYNNFKVYDLFGGMGLVYPGDKKGTFDQRVSYTIWKEALSKANVTLTMHDGATHWIARYIYGVNYASNMKEFGEECLKIAKAFGVGLPISCSYSQEYSGISDLLAKNNIKFITPELGGMRMLWNNDVEQGIKGIFNVMKYLKMIDGEPEPSEQIIFDQQKWIRSNHGGVLIPAFSPLDIPLKVEEGEELCTIKNTLGDKLEVIKSPFKGIVFCARAHCAVHSGDWLYGVGKPI